MPGNSDARAALRHLTRADSVMARIIAQVGPLKMARRPRRFQALVRAIIFQQLAGRAAQAIYGRFVALFDGRFPTPRQVLEKSPRQLRRVGLSRAKTAYIRDLARHVLEGRLRFDRFHAMDDEAIIADLTRVHGIGRWTAEMFLMFSLGRPDVLPVDDLGLRNAAAKAYGLARTPQAAELRALGERWRPHRSAAVWYLWQLDRVVAPDGNAGTARPRARVRRRSARSAARKPNRS